MKTTRHDIYQSQVRMLVTLILSFAVLPGALLISVGILLLVFGHQAHDYVFGILILALAATLIAGITATFLYVKRSTSLARLKTEFAQRVSHDLRTPLTSIRMFVETLQSGRLKDPERIKECLDVLAMETDRLSSMVERLLKWASMEAGRRVYVPRPAEISAVVDNAMRALLAQLKLGAAADVEILRQDAPSAANVQVDVDVDAMAEALTNVLQNAVKYTGADRRVTLRTERHEKEVMIAVTDSGPGIAKEEHGRIFEKFYRVVDPANPNISGSGLGLAIVHNIVKAHAGRVTVESDVGKGATFFIWLPIVTAGMVKNG